MARTRRIDARSVSLVAAGGALGAASRYGLLEAGGVGASAPVTLGVNALGAFLLGLLLEMLTRARPDTGRRRDVRLLVGTGLLGGFTTYSGIAVEVLDLAAGGRAIAAAGYGLATVGTGLAACAVGVAVGSSARRGP